MMYILSFMDDKNRTKLSFIDDKVVVLLGCHNMGIALPSPGRA